MFFFSKIDQRRHLGKSSIVSWIIKVQEHNSSAVYTVNLLEAFGKGWEAYISPSVWVLPSQDKDKLSLLNIECNTQTQSDTVL